MKTLLKNALLYTPDGAFTGYLAVEDKTIVSIGKERPAGTFDSEKDMSGKMILPGLVNGHTHTPMTLLRGVGTDLPLQKWLFDVVFPIEARLTDANIRTGAELALLEMLSSGTTSFSDMYFYPLIAAEVIADSGIKANLCQHVQGFDPNDRFAGSSFAQKAQALQKAFHGAAEGRIQVDACLHAEYTNFSDDVVRGMVAFAKENGLHMHVHLSETEKEHLECKERRNGLTPAAWFEQMGVFDQPCAAAHCVWIEDGDVEIFRRHGVTVVHNPTSNMKLGSGFAPIPKLLEAGVNVSIGTDGTASNNNLNMFEELHLASVIHNGYHHDAAIMPAKKLVEMATVNGARQQGRNTGELTVGKCADLIAIDMDRPHLFPCLDAAGLLAYSAQGSDVVMTMVDGRILYENGEFLTLDKEKILFEAKEAVKQLYA